MIGVGVIGLGWMGRVHAQAYLRVAHHYPVPAPRLVVAADPVAGLRADAARRYGFGRTTGDWAEVLADPDVHAVSVTVPNFLHAEVGAAAARAGKHIWIEKPVGRDATEAATVAAAVAAAGVRATVGFNYRHAPAVAYARELIAAGRIGAVTHARFRLLSDYAADPKGALSWRFVRERGGSGVLGDLMSHGVDLARYLVGPIEAVVADEATFVPRRPVPGGATSHFATVEGGVLGDVENEDYVGCLARFAGGARGTLEASRVSVGSQCDYGFEIHGTEGVLAWDFRRMGELRVGGTTVHVGPGHGEYAAFQPGPGIAMGYDDLKVIEAAGFLRSIVDGTAHGPTIDDAVHAARVVAAMAESAHSGRWVNTG
ncbi:Gfo/Idh/MocA family protein [Phytohabitans rumicis]|uniref:Oxidoreductase n=1 Tax=Phytohabitans rumicis TaxID=1076125 RepID=A0A6V8L694_9ACTN|nr:Gfo/Idh/MocA family oxidoreductase [Phytohabitans rumicis]GFJ88175.1 oxidoreductase [Phytohabitans rumicis]